MSRIRLALIRGVVLYFPPGSADCLDDRSGVDPGDTGEFVSHHSIARDKEAVSQSNRGRNNH